MGIARPNFRGTRSIGILRRSTRLNTGPGYYAKGKSWYKAGRVMGRKRTRRVRYKRVTYLRRRLPRTPAAMRFGANAGTVPADAIWSHSAMPINTLYAYEPILNTVATFDRSAVSARQRNYIDVSSFEVHIQIFGDATLTRPMVFHFACIILTDKQWSGTGGGFFTSKSSGTQGRTSVPFGSAEVTAYNGTPRNYYNMSTEEFVILFRKRTIVYPDLAWVGNSSYPVGSKWTTGQIHEFRTLKQRFTFDNTASTSADPKMLFVYWLSPTTLNGTYPALTTMEGRVKVYSKAM